MGDRALGLGQLLVDHVFVGGAAQGHQPVLDVINHSTTRYVARAKYASGEPEVDERKVRVYVRQLPQRVAVAEAAPFAGAVTVQVRCTGDEAAVRAEPQLPIV